MQPAEAELVAGSEQDDNGSGNRDFRKRESELHSRVRGLTCLGARWKVSTGDEIEPTGRRTLTMRHISIVDDRQASAPARLRRPFPQTCSPGPRRLRPCRNRSAEPPIWSRVRRWHKHRNCASNWALCGLNHACQGRRVISPYHGVEQFFGDADQQEQFHVDTDVSELAEGSRAGAAPAPGRFSILQSAPAATGPRCRRARAPEPGVIVHTCGRVAGGSCAPGSGRES